MGITKDYQVTENRIFFKCPSCGTKKTMFVPRDLRQVSTRCYKCGEVTKCRLNRRIRSREQQSGKIIMVTNNGVEYEISLNDISETGVGFDIPIGIARAHILSPGHEVRFRCSWNANLLGNIRFEVQSVRGQRIGAKKIVV